MRRSTTLLSLCLAGRPTCDLCCDHGYLGTAALRSGLFPRVIFNDQVADITQALEQRLTRQGLTEWQIHCGNAAQMPLPEAPANIVIAGVGARTIIEIVSAHGVGPHRWILSPHKSAWDVEALCTEHPEGALTSHLTVLERGRERPIFVFEAPSAD